MKHGVPDTTAFRVSDGLLLGRFAKGVFIPRPGGIFLVGRFEPQGAECAAFVRELVGVYAGTLRLLHHPFEPFRVGAYDSDTLTLSRFFPGESEDDVIALLRSESAISTPAQQAELLRRRLGSLTQGLFVTYFKRSFPSIPLQLLYRAAEWRGLGGSMSDEHLNAILRPFVRGSASDGT